MTNQPSLAGHPGQLSLPSDVSYKHEAIELLSAWYVANKVHVITRAGTRLDEDPALWGGILATIADNIVSRQCKLKGREAKTYLDGIKCAFESEWTQIAAKIKSEEKS